MSKKLPAVSGKQTVKAFVKLGFTVRMGKGDHVVLQKDHRVFSVPCIKRSRREPCVKFLK